MATIEYSNVSNELHTQVLSILQSDSTISGKTSNVMDGSPKELWKGRGFPYILVHTPVVSEEKKTQTKFMMVARMKIEIVSIQESKVRALYDNVRNALKTNRKTISVNHAYNYVNASTAQPIPTILNGKTVWTITMTAQYQVMS